MREHGYPMIFTTTSQEVLTQHCSIRGQRHGNDKLGCLLIVVNYCRSNCCSGPTMMLKKERTQVRPMRLIIKSAPSCTAHWQVKYTPCTWYQHSCRNLWRLQEIYVCPLEGFAVVCLQMATHRKHLHKRHKPYCSPIMCSHTPLNFWFLISGFTKEFGNIKNVQV